MTDEKDADGNLMPDEVRLTKFGKLLRETSLDELPKAINIVKGDMSVIGPRPLLVKYLPRYSEHQNHRHDVTVRCQYRWRHVLLINNIYNKKPINVWIYSFLISDLWLVLALSNYLISNWNELWQYSHSRLFAIFLAALWTYIGPVLIIKWMSGYNDFCERVESIPDSNGCAKEIKVCVFDTYKAKIRNRRVSVVWVILVVTSLILPTNVEVLNQYLFKGYADYNYWIFIVCVAYIAYQTSSFFLMLFISWRSIQIISENGRIMRHMILSAGKSDGLTLIGDLISRTVRYFSSGLLFFPIMIDFFISAIQPSKTMNTSAFVFILMAIFIFGILSYIHQIDKAVVEKGQIEKDKMLNELNAEREEYNNLLDRYFIDQKIRYIANINVNPVVADIYLKIIYGIITSALLPSVFTYLLSIGK